MRDQNSSTYTSKAPVTLLLITWWYRAIFLTFVALRSLVPAPLKKIWGIEDEQAWQRSMAWLCRGKRVVLDRDGMPIHVRTESLGDLFAAFGRREEVNVEAAIRRLAPGDVVLDIGAHIGGFSLIAARAVGPDGQVFAFEPVPDNADLLERNALINGARWLHPVRAAVGRKNGSIELFVSDTDTMWASTRLAWSDILHHGTALAHVTTQRVPLVTVDDFLREQGVQKVRLMKIDVEGAEMDVLAGGADSLARACIKEVIVEIHGTPVTWKHVAAILQLYGYEVRDLGGSEMQAVLLPQLPDPAQLRVGGKKPVTVALIGCGAVSEILYAQALDALAGEGLIETVGLVDPNPERTAKIGNTLPTARPYRDLDGMFAEIVPDLAIIATPHRFHANLAATCLNKGVHVLCEKPMALTTAECDRMIEAAKESGCILAVGLFRRFFPSRQIIKSILETGLLGPVRSFRFLEGETYSWPAQSASFSKRTEAGGGVLIDDGAHTLDLLLWWLGNVEEIQYEDDAMGGVEANCRLRLRMTSGAKGIVQLSRDWPLPNRYVIECEKAWIALMYDGVDHFEWGLHHSNYGLDSQIRLMDAVTKANMHELGSSVQGFIDCFVAQLRNVTAAMRGTETLLVSGVDARRSIALIERCYHNRSLLEMPWLEERERRHAEELAHA